MSFRGRLTLFFVLIVIVPMVSVAFVLFRLISDNEAGKADARVAARQEAAINLALEARRSADEATTPIGQDPGLAVALRTGDDAKAQRRAKALRERIGATRVVVRQDGRTIADAGSKLGVFPATRQLVGATGRGVAVLQVATTDARSYAKLVQRVTGQDVVVRRGPEVLAATRDGSGRVELPPPREAADVEVGGDTLRAATFAVPGSFEGRTMQVSLLQGDDQLSDDVSRSRLLAASILAGFFILAFTFAVLVSRTLQRQIESFLAAARRLGEGDFSSKVPTTGRDEFAALGEEFNKMSVQLEQRLQELSRERARLQLALRRIGETFASNLDRDALLEIVVQTAVDGVGATGGHARVENAEVARVGTGSDQAEHVLAHPLRGAGGVVSVWRDDRAFTDDEQSLFHYLAGQAAVSVENVGLHEVVERQAVTDELTGLANRRRFQETLTGEVERAKRFGQDLGLVMLDIDNFKKVNDTYGHQQGDLVLKEVARVLRESAREIDEPARYGGEELACVLPGTDLTGAHNFGERVREGIEALELPVLGGDGETMQVTASLGAAALPASGGEPRELVAAADEALYEAKRSGKNRTVRAG